jgi:hypothetical protein
VNGLFDPKKSSTYKKLELGEEYVGWKCPFFSKNGECGFTQGYTEGSMYKGTLIYFLRSLGEVLPRFPFQKKNNKKN